MKLCNLFLILTNLCGYAFAQSKETLEDKIIFSSRYTDLQSDCLPAYPRKAQVIAQEGGDMPLLCQGPADYHVSISFPAMGASIAIMKGTLSRRQFFSSLASQGQDWRSRKVEWRLVNDQPFAVIFRRYDYEEKNLEPNESPSWDRRYKKVGETLLVRGLKGFEQINYSLDVSKEVHANEKARELADSGYKNAMMSRKNNNKL